ncbi:hypothetical protein [Haloplanus halophilus]|uniref:hypothetical protein n=1 Tax=Haloplanus halophilus TaxID=2949993 RepID=UPI00203D04CA|nr:hypothetical protein [Haloplanus sp. GDY1]
MTGRDSDPSTLVPISPSKVPDVPGNGRTWFAVLMALTLLTGVLFSAAILLVSVWDALVTAVGVGALGGVLA